MQGTNCRVYPQRCFMLAPIKWGEKKTTTTYPLRVDSSLLKEHILMAGIFLLVWVST